jgi:hypothetical protein
MMTPFRKILIKVLAAELAAWALLALLQYRYNA